MRILVDANMPRTTAPLLRAGGFDAVDVRDVGLRDAGDLLIAARAREERRCLITMDTDFCDIRTFDPERYFGIVVFRLSNDAPVSAIELLVTSFFSEPRWCDELPGALAIVSAERIRIRRTGV